MSSLHAQLISCNEDDKDKLQALNTRFHLVNDSAAMRLPALFGSTVWRGVKPLEKMEFINDRYFERLVRRTPCWLMYTDKEAFIKELREMVGFCVEEYNLAVRI